MSTRPTRLLELVPGVYRHGDSQLPDKPLERLLAVFGAGLGTLDKSISGLLDDHFVERASPEALALLAELYAARLLGEDVRVNRAVVARSIGWRRRRGTLPTLEEIIALTTGWSGEVEEAFRSLTQTVDVRLPLLGRGRTPNLIDPIALADPLSRRLPPAGERNARDPWSGFLGPRRHETLDQTLVRLGRADAGRHATSPRTLDLRGWARPEVALIRTSRLVPVEYEGVEPLVRHALPGGTGIRLDPLDRDTPLVWLQPLQAPHRIATLTAVHEPDERAKAVPRTGAMLLTPTALAREPDVVEAAGGLTLMLEGVPLIGPKALARVRSLLSQAPVGPSPRLRLVDLDRPGPGDAFELTLLGVGVGDSERLLRTSAVAGVAGAIEIESRAKRKLGGRTIAIRLQRTAGKGATRASDGTWKSVNVAAPNGLPRSNVAAVRVGGEHYAHRLERRPHADGDGYMLALTRLEPALERIDTATAFSWVLVAQLADDELDDSAPGPALLGHDDQLWLAGSTRGGRAALWWVEPATAELERADVSGTGPIRLRSPAARKDPSLCAHAGRLYLYGGSNNTGASLDDLWSLPLVEPTPANEAARVWQPTIVRKRGERVGGTLLSTAEGLVLIGGQSRRGRLDPTVLRCDPSASRPQWRPLPSLPVEVAAVDRARPGRVVASTDGVAIQALVWDDRTRPVALRWAVGEAAWTLGGSEASAPNPPAAGEAVVFAGRVVIAGPSPLPPSEVLFSQGGETRLAFLPALVGWGPVEFDVSRDGSSARRFAAGQTQRDIDPPGPPLAGPLDRRDADGFRLTSPRRLSRHRYRLRQRSLGPWAEPHALSTEGVVSLDPRLGRVLLPQGLPEGRLTASFRVGRGSSIGVGTMPPNREPPRWWLEPGQTLPIPPDLQDPNDREQRACPVSCFVSPRRAGQTLRHRGRSVPVAAELTRAISRAPATETVLAIVGSARLPSAHLAAGVGGEISIVASDGGSVPFIEGERDDASLTIHPGQSSQVRTGIWLAGLWLASRLDLVLAEGRADIRWSTLAQPGQVGLCVAGAGHQHGLNLETLVKDTVEVVLIGCMVGRIELPPWCRLVAAGCTFDAGSDEGLAIAGAGGRVVLRHCTVRGRTRAAELRASSCVFTGAVEVDRKDLGWLRHSLLSPSTRAPVQHLCVMRRPSVASHQPTDPRYLVLSPNNGATALSVGEEGRLPGAHADRSDRLRELELRTEDHLPMGLVAHQQDRTRLDLHRTNRRPK